MPIYEYHCNKCGDFEVMQKMSDKALTQCPTCRRKVTKLISNTSFQLKGSGWYITDYARKDAGAGKAATGASDSSTDTTSTASKETTASTPATSESTKTESTGAKKKSAAKKSSDKPAAA